MRQADAASSLGVGEGIAGLGILAHGKSHSGYVISNKAPNLSVWAVVSISAKRWQKLHLSGDEMRSRAYTSCLFLLFRPTLLPHLNHTQASGRRQSWNLNSDLSDAESWDTPPGGSSDCKGHVLRGKLAFPKQCLPSRNIRVLMDLLSLTGWPASSTCWSLNGTSVTSWGLEIWSSLFSLPPTS